MKLFRQPPNYGKLRDVGPRMLMSEHETTSPNAKSNGLSKAARAIAGRNNPGRLHSRTAPFPGKI
jgi:hypothetical protein